MVIIILTWLLNLGVKKSSSRILAKFNLRYSLEVVLTRLLSIAVWVSGLLIAAVVVFPGLTPTKALGGLGVVSMAVGFAFKDIFENFFAGLLLLWKFPFEPHDVIECENISGTVKDVTLRMTEIRTLDGELIVVPNSFLFKNPVEIYTNPARRRISLTCGVAYEADVDRACEVIREAISACDSVDQEKEIHVLPFAFGSSSIDIDLKWWAAAEPIKQLQSKGEVISSVKAALDSNQISIPFPQRSLQFKGPLRLERDAAESTSDQE